jgi:hypothetical protein
VETVYEVGFNTSPCTIEDLLVSKPHVATGVDVEVTREGEGVPEEGLMEGGGALDDVSLGVKELLGFG